jgi:MFS family permease
MSVRTSDTEASSSSAKRQAYNRFLLLVAGLGGLLYGVDVGIIGGALPYLEATSKLSVGQLSIVVAAVLLGSVISTLFAGLLADWMGRKRLMALSGLFFVASIPAIALSQGFVPLFLGRLLQGISGGVIGVVVPLYLAECLVAKNRGKGAGIFQWLLTFGIVFAALIGIYYSYRVEEVIRTADATTVFAFKDQAWRRIFWVSLPPGILFVIGSLMVAESPRWLFRRGKKEAAHAALLKSRSPEDASLEMTEMEQIAAASTVGTGSNHEKHDSLLRRKYVVPFILACVILFCNTATGINSIIGYNTNILLQSGLSDVAAHWGYVIFTAVNFLITIIGMTLVDRSGRKSLLTVGTLGITVCLAIVAFLFLQTEKRNIDCSDALQSAITSDQQLSVTFDKAEAAGLIATKGASSGLDSEHASLVIIYSYGGFSGVTSFARTDDNPAKSLQIKRDDTVPANPVEAFFKNPFANLQTARNAPLKIEHAFLGPVPSVGHGWLVAIGLYAFVAFFAAGPGVCVWLALSELMPTRIRSNGMSIALVINQLVSTTLAAIFLPVVSKYGYSFIFFMFAGFTVIYFVTARFYLPETRGKTLEEIEAMFEGAAH